MVVRSVRLNQINTLVLYASSMGSVVYPRTQAQVSIIVLFQAEKGVKLRCSCLPAEVWQKGSTFLFLPYCTQQTLKHSPLHHPIAQEVSGSPKDADRK